MTNHVNTTKIARMVGTFFIIATVTSVLSYLVILEPLLNVPDYLGNIAANKNLALIGILLDLVNCAAVVVIPAMLLPILNKYSQAGAVGYLASRIIESAILIVGDISLLSLVTVSQAYAQAATPDASNYQIVGTALRAASDWTFLLGPGIAFGLTALILNGLLVRTQLVPRWISIWGLIGAALLVAGDLMAIFGFDLVMLLAMPIALQEMVLAVWLIVKGFNSRALAALPGETA